MEKTALLRLHFIVFLWGFTAILGKMIEVDAPNLVFYRMFFTAGILFFYLRIFRKQSLAVSRSILIKLLGVGTLIALHWLFFFASIKASNVSIALSCMSLPTLFVSVLEPLVFRRKIDWLEIVIGMVIVACILLIFNVEIRY
ncbi:MAG: EamA family transporter, partial [Bergeyella zoohelcum]|nr:EamA family transporter [Bergeyella zoohelcum]